jgi:hypothetical protein
MRPAEILKYLFCTCKPWADLMDQSTCNYQVGGAQLAQSADHGTQLSVMS